MPNVVNITAGGLLETEPDPPKTTFKDKQALLQLQRDCVGFVFLDVA